MAYLVSFCIEHDGMVAIPGVENHSLVRGADVWATVKGQRPPAEIVVRGVGKQFREFIYPGADDKFGSEDDLT